MSKKHRSLDHEAFSPTLPYEELMAILSPDMQRNVQMYNPDIASPIAQACFAAEHLYPATKKLGQYCMRENIGTIVFLDPAARLARIGLWQYLAMAHPDKPKPTAHFMYPTLVDGTRYRQMAAGRLSVSGSTLANHSDSPVLVFDICSHTGQSLTGVQTLLRSGGLTNVRTGAFTYTPPPQDFGHATAGHPDFIYRQDVSILGCGMYSGPQTILQPARGLYAQVERDPECSQYVHDQYAFYRRYISNVHAQVAWRPRLPEEEE